MQMTMSTLKNNWHRCDIDPKLLKELSKRSDRRAMPWIGGHLALLLIFGTAAVLTWGTWWALPCLLAYCGVWGCATSAVHELCHKTPFRSRWLNDAALWIFGWMVQMEPVSLRWAHAGHHSHTHFDEGDTELSEPNPVTWKKFFAIGSGLGGTYFYSKSLLLQAFGKISDEMLEVIPPKRVPEAVFNARAMTALYAAVFLLAVIMQSWLPIALTLGARIIGGPISGFLHLTQHTCLQMNVRDHRHSTRSFTAGPVLRFFYFNMNHHIEHHMFPMVPFYNLPRLSQALESQLPPPCRGIAGVYREIIPAIARQRKDPEYFIRKSVPSPA